MTAHKEFEMLWQFIRGCLCNDVFKSQTTGAVWLKSRIFFCSEGQNIKKAARHLLLSCSPGSGVGFLLPLPGIPPGSPDPLEAWQWHSSLRDRSLQFLFGCVERLLPH